MMNRAEFVNEARELLARHGERLAGLVGRTIDATWIARDVGTGEWFPDETVIVQVGNDRIEVVCSRLSELAITWNQVDTRTAPARVADWQGLGFALEWRRDALPVLQRSVGKTLRGVNVLEYLHRTTVVADTEHPGNVGEQLESWLLNGVELTHDAGSLIIFNALDENGVSDEPFDGSNIRRTRAA